MTQPQRKVVAELAKVWEAVVAKGKVKGEGRVNEIKSWIKDNPSFTNFQNVLNEQIRNKFKSSNIQSITSGEVVPERTKLKFGRLMAAYEELIGISEVKNAHARVLSTEAKFIECQEQRRLASKNLSEIQNQLTEVRAELDRTQRGDDTYLDLIRKEISAIKEERIMRKHFEELERAEREVFAELSSALRFSHEKERAQNEKTKYWSIVGSIIGAALGILGTTINNKMKQNHLKRILGETSSQVAAIQSTVENLTTKVNQGTLSLSEVNKIIESLKTQERQLTEQHAKLSKSVQDSVRLLQNVIATQQSNPNNNNGGLVPFMSQVNLKDQIVENKWQVTAVLCCAISVLLYKYI